MLTFQWSDSVGRVLVVDNDTRLADLVALLLRRRGHTVTVRHDVASALAFASQTLLDVVVCDLRMQAMDGDVLVRALQAQQDGPPVVMMTAETDLAVLSGLVREGIHGLVIKPFEPSLLLATIEIAIRKWSEIRALRGALRAGGATGADGWMHARSDAARVATDLESQRLQLEADALAAAGAVEAMFSADALHSERFARFAVTLAAAAGCSPAEVEAIRAAAPWHDLGMAEIDPALRGLAGVWTEEQRCLMRAHALLGAKRLGRGVADLASASVRMARTHHERWDGGGYPDGLAGERIPLEGRVAAVADALDAMTSPRPYRAVLPWEAALAEVVRCSGTAFDPRIVEAAVSASTELEQIALALRAR